MLVCFVNKKSCIPVSRILSPLPKQKHLSFICDGGCPTPVALNPSALTPESVNCASSTRPLIYMSLQPARFTQLVHSCKSSWAFTSRFHPYQFASELAVIFCGTFSPLISKNVLTLSGYGTLCCPDFPPRVLPQSDRSAYSFAGLSTSVSKNRRLLLWTKL